MRRSIRCQPAALHHEDHHHDFANFQAFMSPASAPSATTTPLSKPLTYGNPLQFVPSASHAVTAAVQQRKVAASPDVFRQQRPSYNSSPTKSNKNNGKQQQQAAPSSPATSGSSSYVAWPSTTQDVSTMIPSPFDRPQQPTTTTKPLDTSRQTALTTSMAASSFDDDEEQEIPSWEEFQRDATTASSSSPYRQQQQPRGGAMTTSRTTTTTAARQRQGTARSVQPSSPRRSHGRTTTASTNTATRSLVQFAQQSRNSSFTPQRMQQAQDDDDDDDFYPDPDISVGMHNSDEDDEEEQQPELFQPQYRGAPAPRLSHDVLRYKESLEPPVHYPSPLSKGYCGLYDKTKAVPCLLDETESTIVMDDHFSDHNNNNDNSRNGSPRILRELHNTSLNDVEALSDVFDGIMDPPNSNYHSPDRLYENRTPAGGPKKPPAAAAPRAGGETTTTTIPAAFAMVRLKGGLSAIQTTPDMFRNRTTKSVVSESSSSDGGGSTDNSSIPDHQTMVSAGRRLHDNAVYGIHTNILSSVQRCPQPAATSAACIVRTNQLHSSNNNQNNAHYESSDGEYDHHGAAEYWYRYRVDPDGTAELVRTYREISEQVSSNLGLAEYELADDERKVFALYEMRSRIMEKDLERGLERRGGTIATDDLVTTSYHRTSHRIRDGLIVSKAWRDGATVSDVIRTEQLTRKDMVHWVRRVHQRVVSYESVEWLDDTDFHQYRCPSLSGRQTRGGEMFTIGDCQSMLLKLTNDRCMELRNELNDATARQIDAEEQMKAEGDDAHGMMSEAELTYLTTMEEVKMLSGKLVASEQAYELVRERIESLLNKYEKLLAKIETESFTGGSSVLTDSTYFSEFNTSEYWDQMDRLWARRAKRAELQAELAARQVLLNRTQSHAARIEKRREIEALMQKLEEVRSDSLTGMDQQRRAAAKMISPHKAEPATKNKVDSVKQRFRDRMAQRQQQQPPTPPQQQQPSRYSSPFSQPPVRQRLVSLRTPEERNLLRSAGEEMCSQMDFYERSLKAVDTVRRTS